MSAPESLPDQAEGLRKATPKPVRVICVTGGKGGVGKTSVSVNLAVAMADAGRHVLLLDADLGLANVDVLLGLSRASPWPMSSKAAVPCRTPCWKARTAWPSFRQHPASARWPSCRHPSRLA